MQSSGIAICRNAIARMIVVTPLLIILFLSSLQEVSRAQCPTGILPPGCSWNLTGQYFVFVPGTSCSVTADFCSACCNGQIYFYIYNMTPSSSACDDVDPQQMENALVASNFTYGTLAFSGCSLGTCPATTVVNVMTPTCWQKNGVAGAWTYSGCGTGSCYCVASAQVCITQPGNVITLSGCTSTQIGVCTCTPDPGAANLWITGQSYQLMCPPPPC
jgi:hypothetical protein